METILFCELPPYSSTGGSAIVVLPAWATVLLSETVENPYWVEGDVPFGQIALQAKRGGRECVSQCANNTQEGLMGYYLLFPFSFR